MSIDSGTGPGVDQVPDDVTMREITELVRLFEASDLVGLELQMNGMRLVLGTPAVAPAAPPQPTPAAPTPTPAPALAPEPVAVSPAPVSPVTADPVPSGGGPRVNVTAPVVGTFWAAPSPGEAPFVQLGDVVDAGQQLAIVEVMKLMSPVSSPVAGRIVEICVENAELVEYEQVVFVIESADD